MSHLCYVPIYNVLCVYSIQYNIYCQRSSLGNIHFSESLSFDTIWFMILEFSNVFEIRKNTNTELRCCHYTYNQTACLIICISSKSPAWFPDLSPVTIYCQSRLSLSSCCLSCLSLLVCHLNVTIFLSFFSFTPPAFINLNQCGGNTSYCCVAVSPS